ncbi:MAG TPA: hypothetical protein VFA68_19145 [Terriglobales bacterium]|nr:hypothetical protein [Terriglobales bacterium]
MMLSRTVTLAGLLMLLSPGIACNRQPGVQNGDESAASNQQLPFDRSADSKGISPTAAIPPTTIPSGTPITVRLQSAVSSAVSHSGESFDAVLDDPLIIDGQTVAPRGSAVVGRVISAKASGHLKDPGFLRLTLVSLSINGKELPIQTSSIFAKGASHEKRNLAMIGGGTAAGALIGGLAGGGKGALIGTAIGAAGGTGTAYATGKKDVAFGAERRLTFRLTRSVSVQG